MLHIKVEDMFFYVVGDIKQDSEDDFRQHHNVVRKQTAHVGTYKTDLAYRILRYDRLRRANTSKYFVRTRYRVPYRICVYDYFVLVLSQRRASAEAHNTPCSRYLDKLDFGVQIRGERFPFVPSGSIALHPYHKSVDCRTGLLVVS